MHPRPPNGTKLLPDDVVASLDEAAAVAGIDTLSSRGRGRSASPVLSQPQECH
jgi:hypothetical protein